MKRIKQETLNQNGFHESAQTTEELLSRLYATDQQSFENFVAGKTKKMDFASVKRLVLSELAQNHSVRPQRICGFTRQQIMNISQAPEKYGKQILRLMDYVYLKSGYVRRLIDYFCNMPRLRYYVDTEALNTGMLTADEAELKDNYLAFCAQAGKYNLSNNIHDILKRMYLNDVCFAYVTETDLDISYFFLDPQYCEIKKVVNGSIYEFAINRSLLTDTYFASLPEPLQKLICASHHTSRSHLVDIPYENSFCLKYHNNFPYVFPPFFPLIADILLIDEYKELAKSQAVSDAYRLLVLKLPTRDGELTMGDEITLPFISTAMQVVPENIGVLPVPFETERIEFSEKKAEEKDKVSEAITWAYKNAGVSEALLSGALKDSGLQLSVANDSGDIFRIYRMIENWVSLQQKLRGFLYESYRFTYGILDITLFNEKDVVEQQLRLSRTGLPNKGRLCASAGISPSALVGNSRMEQEVFESLFRPWQPADKKPL